MPKIQKILHKNKNPPNKFGGQLTKPYVGQSTNTLGGEVKILFLELYF